MHPTVLSTSWNFFVWSFVISTSPWYIMWSTYGRFLLTFVLFIFSIFIFSILFCSVCVHPTVLSLLPLTTYHPNLIFRVLLLSLLLTLFSLYLFSYLNFFLYLCKWWYRIYLFWLAFKICKLLSSHKIVSLKGHFNQNLKW